MTIIEVRGLTKVYGAPTAVGGVDLDVAEGEIFGLLGPKGTGNGPHGVRPAVSLDPDVVLKDLLTPGGGGVEAVAALDAGATGYLLKDAPRDELVGAIRAAAAVESVLSPAVAIRVVSRLGRQVRVSSAGGNATSWGLVVRGRSNREIAAAPFVSEATVKTHLRPYLRQARRERPRGCGRDGVRPGAARRVGEPPSTVRNQLRKRLVCYMPHLYLAYQLP